MRNTADSKNPMKFNQVELVSISLTRKKIVQMTPNRKQAAWNIYIFCQEFIISTTQIYGPSLLVTYKTQISH